MKEEMIGVVKGQCKEKIEKGWIKKDINISNWFWRENGYEFILLFAFVRKESINTM